MSASQSLGSRHEFYANKVRGHNNVIRFSCDDMCRYRTAYMDPPCPNWTFRTVVLTKLDAQKSEEKNKVCKGIMHISEIIECAKPWQPNRHLTHDEELVKIVRGCLNRLTPEKYSKIIENMCDTRLFESEQAIRLTVHEITQKALQEPKYTATYAMACFDMARVEVHYKQQQAKGLSGYSEVNNQDRKSRFRAILLHDVQMAFGKAIAVNISSIEGEKSGKSNEATSDVLDIPKEESVANVRFIGELVLQKLISTNNCIGILEMLLCGLPYPDELNIELFCTLIFIIGATIGDRSEMRPIFARFEDLCASSYSTGIYSHRIRFMIRDTLDMRDNNWVRVFLSREDSHEPSISREDFPSRSNKTSRATSLSERTLSPLKLFCKSGKSQPRPFVSAESVSVPGVTLSGDKCEIVLPLPELSIKFQSKIQTLVDEIGTLILENVDEDKKVHLVRELMDKTLACEHECFGEHTLRTPIPPTGATLVACAFNIIIHTACLTTKASVRKTVIQMLGIYGKVHSKSLEVGACSVFTHALSEDMMADTPLYFERYFEILDELNDVLSVIRVLRVLRRGLEFLEFCHNTSDSCIVPFEDVKTAGQSLVVKYLKKVCMGKKCRSDVQSCSKGTAPSPESIVRNYLRESVKVFGAIEQDVFDDPCAKKKNDTPVNHVIPSKKQPKGRN